MSGNDASGIGTIDVAAVLFPAAFVLVALWETFHPARPATTSIWPRWSGNIVLLLLAWSIAALLPFLSGVGAALIASQYNWGLLNTFPLPAAVAIPLSFVALDFAGYWEHRLLHASPFFWRLHALHHSDADVDITTAVRHHPFEVVAKLAIDAILIISCGIAPSAVVIYVTTVTVVQIIHHGNVELPRQLRWIRHVIITPDLHRVHHSMVLDENNANFSNLFSVWDRLFGTLRSQARDGLVLGLPDLTGPNCQRLDRLFLTPWLVGAPNPNWQKS